MIRELYNVGRNGVRVRLGGAENVAVRAEL